MRTIPKSSPFDKKQYILVQSYMQNEGGYGIDERQTTQTRHAERRQLSRYSALIRADVNVSGISLKRSLVHSQSDSPGMQDER